MRGGAYALVAHSCHAPGLSSSSSSDPEFNSFWIRSFFAVGVRLVRLCAAGLAVCTVLYFLASYNRTAETTTHFVTWYALIGLAGIAVALIARQRKLAALCLVFTLFFVALIAPWYLAQSPQPTSSDPNLRVLTANVHSINEQTSLLLDLVVQEDPDIVMIQELSPMWVRALQSLRDAYPYHVERGRPDHFGIGLYSRWPLENSEVFNLADDRYPAIRADIQVNGRLISVLNMHTMPPLTSAAFELRNAQLAAAGEFANGVDDLAIVAGDLNITMWSPYYRALESKSELRNVRRGFGIIPTWPANLPLLGLALDHVLASPDILVVDVEPGPDIGSDHLPLLVELFVPELDELVDPTLRR